MGKKRIAPALLATLRRKAVACGEDQNSWMGYLLVLRYLDDALRRVPSRQALENCDEEGIEHFFETELEHLARTLADIFPARGPEELVYYMIRPPRPRKTLSE